MQIFEYPYIIITIFVFVFLVLGAVGIYFAVRGVNTATGEDENGFSSLNKLESRYKKMGKMRENRCIIYVGVSLGHFRSMHPKAHVMRVMDDIMRVLLQSFVGKDASVAVYGEQNFVALNTWSMDEAHQHIEACQDEIDKCLLKHQALNIVQVRFGSFFAMGTLVHFEEAIGRAKQACMLAEHEKTSHVEWNLNKGKALEKKIKIEHNIENEIDNNRFFLEYQPVLDAKTKRIIGAEVLSRLNSESDGVLTPGSFLSAVDSVGLNDKFDYYIFEKNCKWISNDKKQREGYRYTINFSRSTLCEPKFAEKIIDIAEKYDLNFSCLAVEILEDKNISGEARKQMIDNLSALKEKGVSILLDDFGSGYTTFGDLQNLDISIVKIDKSITQNAVTDTGFIILKNIIQTSKDIGFKALCEGVETKEQEAAAIRAGCDMLQGFYYYKPMSVAQLEKLFGKKTGGI